MTSSTKEIHQNHATFYIVLLKKQECALIHMQGLNVKIGYSVSIFVLVVH